jgi:hypothetical protein
MRTIRAVALCAVLLAATAACGTTDTDGPTSADRAAFAVAWDQQTESGKDSICMTLMLKGEHGVAVQAADDMERPEVFASLLADQCAREGR